LLVVGSPTALHPPARISALDKNLLTDNWQIPNFWALMKDAKISLYIFLSKSLKLFEKSPRYF